MSPRFPSLSRTLLIFRREMLDLLRDRRTLFGMILMPVLIYPLLTVGFSHLLVQQVGRLERQEFHVGLAGWRDLPELRDLLAAPASPWKLRPVEREQAEEARRDLAEGRLQVLVEIPPDAERRIAAGGTAELRVAYNGADEGSLAAWRQFHPALEEARRSMVRRRLRGLSVDPGVLEPFRLETEDASSPSRRGAFFFGRLVCVMLVMMAAVGAFYPAVDAASGEKERGTMQTLLVSPALRAEIVLGKYAAVLAICLVTSALNLASMGLTLSAVSGGLAGGIEGNFAPGAGTVGLMLVILLPMAGLFAAVSLGISACASSYKEAMLYLSPFLLVAVLGSFAPLIPGLPAGGPLDLVPVVNGSLALYRVVQGTADAPGLIVPFAANVLYAALALRWVWWIFEREDVLLRGPVEVRWRFWERAGAPRPHPSAAEGLVYAALVLSVAVFAGRALQEMPFVAALFLGPLWLFLLPMLACLAAGRIDARRALRLRFPGWIDLAIAALTAVAVMHLAELAIAAGLEWYGVHGLDYTEQIRQETRPFQQLFAGGGRATLAVAALAIVAFAPLCEELAFRGFLFASLRPVLGTAAAVALPGILFGMLHGAVLPRQIALAGVGVAFGVLSVRSGSLWTAVAAHAANNAMVLALALPQAVSGALPEGTAAMTWDLRTAGTAALALATAALGFRLLPFRAEKRGDGEPI